MSIAILACVALAGVTLLIIGAIGRRTDDHPVCRRCGFDLIGLPEGSAICSECGADLKRNRAIRHGHRKRRDGLIITGSLLTLLCLAVVGVGVSNIDVNKHKPFWWLARDADSSDSRTHAAALSEINARLVAGVLRNDQIDRIADRALAVQADLKSKWDAAWGDVIENAQAAGKLSAERWQLYAKQAPQFWLVIRPAIARGQPLPYWLHVTNPRVASRSTLYLNLHGFDAKIGDTTLQESSGFSGQLSPNGDQSFGSQVTFKSELDKLKDGPQTIAIKPNAEITQRPPSSVKIATIDVRLSGSFKLLPAGEASAKFKHDDSLRPAVEKVLKVQDLSYGRWSKGRLDASISADNTPVDLAYEIFLRMPDGQEKRLSNVSYAKNTKVGWGINNDGFGELTAPTVDLVFRPSLAVAENTVDLFEPWDGQVVVHNVRVNYPNPRPPTTTARSR